MNKISNFHSSLFILNECHENIERLYFEFSTNDHSGSEYYKNSHLLDIRNYIIMEVASFMDEYEIYFVQTKTTSKRAKPIEEEYQHRVKLLQEIVHPILNTLSRWTGIREYRDNFVAHVYRSRWENVLKIPSQEPYDAPRKYWEVQLMRDLVHMIFGLISQEFKMELIDAFFIGRSLKSVMNPCKNNDEIEIELKKMVDDFTQIIQQKGKAYTLNVSDIDYEPLKQLVNSPEPFSHPIPQIYQHIRNKPPHQ